MRRTRRAWGLLVGTAALLTGLAAVQPPALAEQGPAFGGYATIASATPAELDVYESTIPIPASPQLEMELGYTKVSANTTGSKGRASLLWPGDAVGEGLKVILQTAGLPANDWPVQANSSHPGGQESEEQQPAPGAVMRTSAGPLTTSAETTLSTTCSARSAPAAASCQIPPQLGAIVKASGYETRSTTTRSSTQVSASTETTAQNVSVLDGLLEVDSVHSLATSRSDGEKATGKAEATWSGLRLLGTPITLGPGGAVVAGQPVSFPGLPADPNEVLELLGVTITAPTPVTQRSGAAVTTGTSALVITVDSTPLRDAASVLPYSTLEDVINQLPDDMRQLKALLGSALYLRPKLVITLGKVSATSVTVPALPLLGPALGGVLPPAVSPPSWVPPTAGSSASPGGPDPFAVITGSAPEPGTGPVLSLASVALPPRGRIPGSALVLGLLAALTCAVLIRRTGLALMGSRTELILPDLRSDES